MSVSVTYSELMTQVTSLLSIPITGEFPEVFPDYLPDVHPERKIDFRIDIIPNTLIVSNPLYKMSLAELT